MALQSERIREAGDLHRELSKLSEHPSWLVLERQFLQQKRDYEDQLAKQLLAGGRNAAAIEQRQLDFKRGFLRGAEWILANPELAEAALNKALERETHE